jgi:hypothetical protein
MKHPVPAARAIAAATLFAVTTLLATAVATAQPLTTRAADTPRAKAGVLKRTHLLPSKLDFLPGKDHNCFLDTIALNSSVNGVLDEHDCLNDNDGTYLDFYAFDGLAGDVVTVTLRSSELDTYLFLLDPNDNADAVDDDSGGGTDSMLTHTLDESGEWVIGVNGFFPEDLGAYTLTLTLENDPGPGPSTCVPNANTLCLNNGRFRVVVDWATTTGSGSANVVPVGSEDSGLFWFFDENNWELLVKVLNGCGVNDHYWVFAAATTDLEYVMRVTDTAVAGTTRQYGNPGGQPAPAVTDSFAFATCP